MSGCKVSQDTVCQDVKFHKRLCVRMKSFTRDCVSGCKVSQDTVCQDVKFHKTLCVWM